MRGEVRATATATGRGNEASVELEEGKKTRMWPCRGVLWRAGAGVEAGEIDGNGDVGSPGSPAPNSGVSAGRRWLVRHVRPLSAGLKAGWGALY